MLDLLSLPRSLEIFLFVVGILVVYQVLIRIIRKLFHFPAPALIGFFLDSDIRRWMQPPDAILEGIKSTPGLHALEIGCGSGGFTTIIARGVGPNGTVEALDIQPEMLTQLENKLSRPENRDIKNIRLHRASAYHLPFDTESFDLVYLITVLPEIPDQNRALLEIWRVLKPGGVMAISELFLDPDYQLQSTTIRKGKQAGFELDGVSGNFWSYTVRFYKSV